MADIPSLKIKQCPSEDFPKLVHYLLEHGGTLFEDNQTVIVKGWWGEDQYTISFIKGVAVSYIYDGTLVLPRET